VHDRAGTPQDHRRDHPPPSRGAGERPFRLYHDGDAMSHQFRAVAVDLDEASLTSLRDALPGWEITAVNLVTAATFRLVWPPPPADLTVVQAREDLAETLSLCRILVDRGQPPALAGKGAGGAAEPVARRSDRPGRAPAPLLVLVPSGQESFVRAVLDAGADRCLILPVHPREVASMVAHVRQGSQPGRHTLNLEHAQPADAWRDDGGQG
jgi:hypothetical protein